VRRLTAVVVAWWLVACASAGQPPGGPEDHTPPVIVAVKPESGTLNVRPRQIDFIFDEVVQQQALGATDLSKLFLVSPREGEPDISWHRQRITIKLRKTLRANTTYVVTMFPGLADLRGNVRKEGATVTFSTGQSVPRFGVTGIVFDWAAQHVVANAFVWAILKSDTTLQFVSTSDSTGHFEIGPLDSGTYIVRGLIDQNSNRMIDRNEKWDTTTVPVTTVRPSVELDAIERDSTPPLLANVAVDDSVTLHVTFDKYIDPALPLQPALVQIHAADSSRVEVERVQWAAGFDAAKRAADSLARRAADSVARAKAAPPGAPAQPPPAPAPSPTRLPVGVPGARPAPPPAKPKALPPDKSIVVTLSPATPFVQGKSYRITTRGFRNLVGHATEQTRPFQVPVVKPPPKDTTKRDTTARARPDSARPPATRPPPSPATKPPAGLR
jgi:Bacterial Ig-like domain